MTRYFPLLETRIVLRMVIFGAGMLAVLLVLACAGAVDPNSADIWGAPFASNVSDMTHEEYGHEKPLIGVHDPTDPTRGFNYMHEQMDLPPDEYQQMHEGNGDYFGIMHGENRDGRAEGSSTVSACDAPVGNSPASASAYIATEEFSGEVVRLTGAQTTDIVWDKDNFGGFCYDMDGGVGTETLSIAAGTLTGPDTDRTIDAGALSHTTSPIWRESELHKNLGLTVESDYHGGDSGYWIEFWMDERYVAINGNASKLAKPLVEFNDTDIKTLSTGGEEWDLGGGFTLTAMQILEGEKVWLSLRKNGMELDNEVIDASDPDLQDRVYTYTEDVAGEDDIPIFSCYVSAVFRGTCNNLIQVKYVFLIDNDILQISTGEYYGNMQVTSTTPSQVALGNWKNLYLSQYTSTCQIMGNLSFKTVYNTGAIEFYPHLIRNELPVLSGGGDEFGSWSSGGSIWNSTHKPTATEEFSGEVAELTGAHTADIVWDKNNFGGFCYDIDGSVGTETLSIAAGTLTGPDIDRTIETGDLSYTTAPFWREYELHRNIGLTVERNPHTSDSGYWTEFWRGERYVAINGRPDKLAKPLIEFNDADTKTLATGEAWDLGGGLTLTADQVDLEGNKVWLYLCKNGTGLDSAIINTGSSDLQDRVYSYTADIAGESDVPAFSCYVSGVFRGTESNMIQVKYVFLIDNVVYQISAGDTYDNMEVVSTTPSQVTLENRNNIALSQSPSTHQIMGNLSFKTVDNSCAIEFYPHLIRNELMVLSGGGDEFGSGGCGEYSWNLCENYTIGWYPVYCGWYQVDLRGEKAWIALCKDGVTVDIRMLTEEFKTQVDSECRYSYVKNGTEIINATMKMVFRGCNANMIELGEVYQRAEVDGSILINNEYQVLPSTTEPYGTPWNLFDGYVLTVPDIGLDGEDIRLQLSKDGLVVKEKILNDDYANTFSYTSDAGSMDYVVEAVFRGTLANVVKLKNANQYSSTGTQLMDDESKTYATADPVGEIWDRWEGYSLAPKDIDMEGNKVWLSLLKNGVVVKDAIVDTDDDRWFTYCNATGALVFSTYVSAVFRGTDINTVQVRYTSQYSEVDGRLFIEPDTESWQLQEGYYLTAQETYSNNSVWLQLSKNNKLVDEGLFYNSFDLQNDTTGHTIVSGTISGYNHSYDFVQLASVTQYSEATGTVLATHPSATLYASWSFKYDKTLVTAAYSVGQGAPDLATKNYFIDAYNRNGGLTVLGSPTTEVHRAWGYLVQDFPGTFGYAGGIIMYNPYKNYAYYIHGAIWERYYNLGGPRATTDIEFELGPPVSDIEPYIHTLPPEVSSHGTQFRYQHFEGGALNHNVDTGDVFEIHGAIFAKWGELGYASDELGLVTSEEREAAQSPIGTDGRVSDFEGGHIHWHRTGGHGGTSYETHGAIDAVYCSEGGSGGDLGFPVSDEYVNPSGYPQSDFEGGYITTTDWVNYYVCMNDDTEGPILEITSPADGFHTDEYRIEISGTASDDSDILYGKVVITSRGFDATPMTAECDPETGKWETNIPLVHGNNAIKVVALDTKHNPTEKTISVYCNPPDFSFAQITDVHLGKWNPILSPLLMIERQSRITKAITQIRHRNPQPDFVLITGDLVDYSNDEYFSKFNDIFRGVPTYIIPGNHDRRTDMLSGDDNLEKYKQYIQSITNFNFYHKGYNFIGLDSGEDYDHWADPDLTPEGSGLEEYQLTKIESFDENMPKIIFMHHPVVTEIDDNSGSSPVTNTCPIYGGNDECIALNRCKFIRYCTDYNVQLVLTGHTHKSYDDNVPFSNTRFIQTPSVTIDKDIYLHGYRIIDIKSGKAYPQLYTPTDAHPNVQGSLKCPAHLHAYDSQGRHTGLNASGGVETNIPDSFYIGRYNYSDPNETETILLYNTTEEYRFEIVANLTEEEKASPEIESFNFTVEQQTDDTRTTTAHLSVPLTENTTATLPINLTTTAYTMEIDYDGDGTTDETKDPDSIETNYAPTAAIIAPETGSIYNVRAPVEFNGTGRDPEDGILTNFSMVWYSDINGAIGAGERFSTANLSCGAHRITLMVNDSTGLMSTQSIALTITNDWTPGDLNSDGYITPADAVIALRIAASGAHDDAADVSGDGCVTSLDALMILQAAAGRIEL